MTKHTKTKTRRFLRSIFFTNSLKWIDWVTSELVDKMRERDCIHRKAVETKSDVLWNQYRIIKNQITASMKLAKGNYFRHNISPNMNNASMWKSIKLLLGN